MRITVIDQTKTEQWRWTFWVNFPHIILDGYTYGTKTTAQRKFRYDETWNRVNNRNGTIKDVANVPKPSFVMAKVYDTVKSLINVGYWADDGSNGNIPVPWRHSKGPKGLRDYAPRGSVTVE